jgi:hypothetical protein
MTIISARWFSSEGVLQAIRFFKAPEYEVFCRLISYSTPIYSTTQPLIDVFKSDTLMTVKQLQRFNIRSVSIQSLKFIKSFDQIINNLNNLFLYWYAD